VIFDSEGMWLDGDVEIIEEAKARQGVDCRAPSW